MSGEQRSSQQVFERFARDLESGIENDVAAAKQLESIKIIARNPSNAPFIYQAYGMNILAEAAFGPNNINHPLTSLEAAKVIANALLLQDQMQQVLAETERHNEIVQFYSQPDADHEFLGGRILFLLTYKSNVDFVALVENEELVNRVRSHLQRHIIGLSDHSFIRNPLTAMALTETSKLIYNLASKFPAQMHFFSSAVVELVEVLNSFTISAANLDPPIGQLLNALAVLDWPSSIVREQSKLVFDLSRKLVVLLNNSTSKSRSTTPETTFVSLITVLRRVHELSISEANEYLRLSLLPQDGERDQPLGKSQTLASRLLRLQTAGGFTVLPEAISGLLFDLSNRDATQFVHNIGYGHAAGYLMTHKIPVPEGLGVEASVSLSHGETEINPVTGQRLDAEQPVNAPEMTDAEKEREAERLFVLFERLKATGVMNVENPLRTAQQSGRFEELSDSDSG